MTTENDPTLYGGEDPPARSSADHGEQGHICAPDEEYDLRLVGGEIAALHHACTVTLAALVDAVNIVRELDKEPDKDLIHDIYYLSRVQPKLDAFVEVRTEEEQARRLAEGGKARTH